MGVPGMAASGQVTSTSGATRIVVLTEAVTRDELLKDEYVSNRTFPVAVFNPALILLTPDMPFTCVEDQ